jgi:hypothetical protein
MRAFQPYARNRGDVAVEGAERGLVAGVVGRVQGERDGLGSCEQAASIGVRDHRAAGRGHRPLVAMSHPPVPAWARSMWSRAIPAAPVDKDWPHPGVGSSRGGDAYPIVGFTGLLRSALAR